MWIGKVERLVGIVVLMLLSGLACTDVVNERPEVLWGDFAISDIRDTGLELPPDTGPDTQPDTWPDTQPDTQPDTWPDTWPDTQPDTGPDTQPDTQPDTWTDTSTYCLSDAMCPSWAPRCDVASGICMECVMDDDCAMQPGGGYCDVTAWPWSCKGVSCRSDDDCLFPVELCSTLGAPNVTGYCVPSCFPFDDGMAPCGSTEWCFPSPLESGLGICTSSQAGGAYGDLCDPSIGMELPQKNCGDGHTCIESEDGMGFCYRLCDPWAVPATSGDTCTVSDSCLQLNQWGGPDGYTAYGVCYPSCGYHEELPCLEPSQECSPGELFSTSEDICVEVETLPAGASCEPYGLQEAELCGNHSLCFDLGMGGPGQNGLRCWDICIPTPEEPLGTYEHSDCRRPGAICEGLFETPDLGLCL